MMSHSHVYVYFLVLGWAEKIPTYHCFQLFCWMALRVFKTIYFEGIEIFGLADTYRTSCISYVRGFLLHD